MISTIVVAATIITIKQIKQLPIRRMGSTQVIHLEDVGKKLLVPLYRLSWPRPHLRADETDITTCGQYLPWHNPHFHRDLPNPSLLNKNGININKTLRKESNLRRPKNWKCCYMHLTNWVIWFFFKQFRRKKNHHIFLIWETKKHQQSINSAKPI